jgi:hypothetical protein
MSDELDRPHPADDPLGSRRRSQQADEMLDKYGYVPERVDTVMRALDWHLQYFEYQGTSEHRRRIDRFSEAYFNDKDIGWREGETLGEGMARDEGRFMQWARTTWVQEDICTYLEAAVKNMPPSILHSSDLPYDQGLVIFDRPMTYFDYLTDAEKGVKKHELAVMPLRAIGWSHATTVGRKDRTVGQGIFLWVYTDLDFINGVYAEEFLTTNTTPIHGPKLILVDITAWLFDDELWSDAVGDDAIPQGPLMDPLGENRVIAQHMGLLRRYILALFLFMKQEIVAASEERPPRPAKRRAERPGLSTPDSIVVIHLRRVKQKSKDETEDEAAEREHVEWSHRWIVRAHWRQISDKEGRPRLVPVREHVKGPDDKPLVIKERIVSVDR